jgi:hypothetical protein
MRYLAIIVLCLTGCAPYYAGIAGTAGPSGPMLGLEFGRSATSVVNSSDTIRLYGSAELAIGGGTTMGDAPLYYGVNLGYLFGPIGVGLSVGGISEGVPHHDNIEYSTKSLPCVGGEIRLFLTNTINFSAGYQSVRGVKTGLAFGF